MLETVVFYFEQYYHRLKIYITINKNLSSDIHFIQQLKVNPIYDYEYVKAQYTKQAQ